jgi:hypothetical protein
MVARSPRPLTHAEWAEQALAVLGPGRPGHHGERSGARRQSGAQSRSLTPASSSDWVAPDRDAGGPPSQLL